MSEDHLPRMALLKLASFASAYHLVKIDPAARTLTSLVILLQLFLATSGCAAAMFIWPQNVALVLFPIRRRHVWRMLAKLNSLLLAFLFSLSLLAPHFSPLWLLGAASHPSLFSPLSRSIQFLACFAFATSCLFAGEFITITTIFIYYFHTLIAVGMFIIAIRNKGPFPFWFLDLLIPATLAWGCFLDAYTGRMRRKAALDV